MYLTAVACSSWNVDKILGAICLTARPSRGSPGGTHLPQFQCKRLDSKFTSPTKLSRRLLKSELISDKRAVKMLFLSLMAVILSWRGLYLMPSLPEDHAGIKLVVPKPDLWGISMCWIRAVLAVRRPALLLDVWGKCSPVISGGMGLRLLLACTLLAWIWQYSHAP